MLAGILVHTLCLAISVDATTPEVSYDIWDWTGPCRDVRLFREWVGDLSEMGVTRVEISVPWRIVEPEPGVYALDWLRERVEVCEAAGVGVRLRINSYYSGATPDWYEGDRWLDRDGAPAPQSPPSIMDARFWDHYGPLCTQIAELCQGRDVIYNAFIGIHAELKFADWWTYDASCLSAWREAIEASPRPQWLYDVAGDASLPARPEIPPATTGSPDIDPANRAFIAFREECWREAMRRFEAALREGDPNARLSSPLGESYRRQSAAMSNQDYWGLTRGASQVVHSYDFFWHTTDAAWMAEAAVAAFQGITGLPVVFEFDSSQGMLDLGYSLPHLMALGNAAARQGAGLKLANNSYVSVLPSRQPVAGELVRLWRDVWTAQPPIDPAATTLLFLSKWTQYSYRESTEWVHAAQFGVYKLLRDAGIPLRIVCEDNLTEDLSGYQAIYLAFSPRPLMPASALIALESMKLPMIEEYRHIPAPNTDNAVWTAEGLARVVVADGACPVAPEDLSSLDGEYDLALSVPNGALLAHREGHVVVGYPLGLRYLSAPEETADHMGLALWAIRRAQGTL